MLTRCLPAAVLAAVLVPSMAAADPVTITVHSTQGGGSAVLLPLPGSTPLFIGDVRLPTPDSAVILSIDGLGGNTNYLMHMMLYGASSWNMLKAEVLDPLDADDVDDVPQPSGLPAGFSTSNRFDGFSFAQGAGLERSAIWAGGSANVTADEQTHAGDMLMFTGLAGGADAIRVTFGLRDWDGNRNFLVRLSAAGAGTSTTPEPASMFLIGTGLAGLAAMRRRRQAQPQAQA